MSEKIELQAEVHNDSAKGMEEKVIELKDPVTDENERQSNNEKSEAETVESSESQAAQKSDNERSSSTERKKAGTVQEEVVEAEEGVGKKEAKKEHGTQSNKESLAKAESKERPDGGEQQQQRHESTIQQEPTL